jgi:aminoglycoside phosphotransferase (APT) family kinase protein
MSSIVAGLEQWLMEQWGELVRVDGVTTSSAGARRQNVLFDATSASRHERLVATIIPADLTSLMSVEAETTVRSLAEHHGVPVPVVRGVCSDASYVGGQFFVSDRVDGETIPRQVHRLAERTGIGEHVIHQLGAALARLHAIDLDSAAASLGQSVITRPVAAVLEMLRASLADLLQPEPALSYGLRWLENHAPAEPARAVLVHGDARVGNLIVSDQGLRGILDWEGARTGDPMEDPAWTCIRMWRFGKDAKTAGGLADLDQYRAGYESAGGEWDADRLRWWSACGTLRWAMGLSGQTAAHLNRSVRGIVMAGSGRRVPEMEYDLLLLTRPS